MACQDKESLDYASICNAAGGSYYELNQLRECRKNWETFLQIQESKLEPESLEVWYSTMLDVGPNEITVINLLS